jgi:hypothetical protein
LQQQHQQRALWPFATRQNAKRQFAKTTWKGLVEQRHAVHYLSIRSILKYFHAQASVPHNYFVQMPVGNLTFGWLSQHWQSVAAITVAATIMGKIRDIERKVEAKVIWKVHQDFKLLCMPSSCKMKETYGPILLSLLKI